MTELTVRPGVLLRDVVDADVAELRRIHETPEVSQWWDLPGPDFPWDEPQSVFFTIEVDGAVAGLAQYFEETEPKYRHAGIDLYIDPALHGKGLGSAIVTRIVRYLIDELGHHRIVIDPATENTAAVRAYSKAGFKPVGVMRDHERDADGNGWHDSLLMELLARER